MTGFTFRLGRKDVFVETTAKNKTKKLAEKILYKLELPVNPDTISEVLYWLMKANCEIKTLNNGKQYYDIYGNNFGGYGSFLDDGMTILIKV